MVKNGLTDATACSRPVAVSIKRTIFLALLRLLNTEVSRHMTGQDNVLKPFVLYSRRNCKSSAIIIHSEKFVAPFVIERYFHIQLSVDFITSKEDF